MDDGGDNILRSIRARLEKPDKNPIARARRMVERQVPPARRGPGWDRHWRELEAYLDTPGDWSRGENGPD
ncbi:hypothetical protein LWE61_03185 [Sphingobium sufflavum]|uniref:hypothetical protein n=1 Tax=Sphingobium sufflavum TaxID=1129547 RepID=UPI001F280DDC|nr:hypothetical protein [Sphingobium sufflavum]MCE7795556.1 hypothetical protein [Sphingobium sufflavum]